MSKPEPVDVEKLIAEANEFIDETFGYSFVSHHDADRVQETFAPVMEALQSEHARAVQAERQFALADNARRSGLVEVRFQKDRAEQAEAALERMRKRVVNANERYENTAPAMNALGEENAALRRKLDAVRAIPDEIRSELRLTIDDGIDLGAEYLVGMNSALNQVDERTDTILDADPAPAGSPDLRQALAGSEESRLAGEQKLAFTQQQLAEERRLYTDAEVRAGNLIARLEAAHATIEQVRKLCTSGTLAEIYDLVNSAAPAGSAERAAKEQAWDEGYSHCFDFEAEDGGVSLADNPYRAPVAALDETEPTLLLSVEHDGRWISGGCSECDWWTRQQSQVWVEHFFDRHECTHPVVDAATNVGRD